MKNKSYVDCFMLMGTALSVGTGTLPSGRSQSQPLIEDVFTTVVNLSMIIEEVFVVDPKNMIIKVEGILNQKWVDPRLGANVLTRKKAVAGQIWEPKITNVNGENKFEEMIFWRGYGEGNVLLSKKVKIDIRCSTEYRDFPFDSQFCTLKWGSYRFPDEEVTLIWDEVPIDILNEPWTNEFSLSNVTKDIVMDIKPSGNFSTATLQFILKRNFTHYLMCTGVPCILMVLLNYISLWTELDQRWNLNLVSFCCNLYLYYSSICLNDDPRFTGVSMGSNTVTPNRTKHPPITTIFIY
ncbi:hypothetical protein JTB14_032722 [Gonioctena quinquepunctata]|nr:hypothetical protein JTB14_032722 [Gonioctena quinquepunctata]